MDSSTSWHIEETLRKEIVDYLNNNPLAQDGFPIELFVGVPWSQYLATMSHNGAYGEHITLQAMANVYNVELVVISSLGPDAQTIISPQNSEPIAAFTLGHFAENEGIHCVCLTVPDNTVQSKVNCVEKYSDNILKQHDFIPSDNNILESKAYKNGVISQDHAVEEISGNQDGQEEMVVSVSNKTNDENAVDEIASTRRIITSGATQIKMERRTTATRFQEITFMKISGQETYRKCYKRWR